MQSIICRLFNLRPGEENNAFLFATLSFFWSFSATLASKLSSALFLIHIGSESLPTAYTLEAGTLILCSATMLYAYGRWEIARIFQAIQWIGIVFFSFVYAAMLLGAYADSSFFWYALVIFGSNFFTLGLTSLWSFIDQYYHAKDARRLFGLFSSSVFLGAIATGLLMHFDAVDTPFLLLSMSLVLLLVVYQVPRIERQLSPVHLNMNPGEEGPTEQYTLINLIKAVLSSRYTLLVITVNFLTILLWVITEYSYLSSFEHHFQLHDNISNIGDRSVLITKFIGQCIAIVSFINIFFGLFFYSRIVEKYGVGNILLYSPILFLLTFSGWIFDDMILFPVMGLFIVEGTLLVVDDCNFSLLLKAIPRQLTCQFRVIIESFFEPIGMLTSGALLSIPHINSKMLGLGFAICLLVVAFLLRSQTLRYLFKSDSMSRNSKGLLTTSLIPAIKQRS